MTNSTAPKVLCLYTGPLFHKICLESPAFVEGRYQFVSLREELEQCLVGGSFDFVRAAEMCSKFIAKTDVDIALSLDDYSTPLLSLLVENNEHKFPGPSLESLFLTIDKFYTREVIDIYNAVPFCHINLKSSITSHQLEEMAKVGLPAILKPVNGFGASLVKKVNSTDEIAEAIALMQKHHPPILSDYKPFFSKCLDLTKYPLALSEGMILEKFIDGDILDLDGYVFNKEVYPWAMYTYVDCDSLPDCCHVMVMPCAIAEEVQERAWGMFTAVSKRLVAHGFDNQFVNIQLFLCKNGDIRLLEINGRMSTVNIPMCRKSLSPGDSLEALVRVASGVKPLTPSPTGVHSAFIELHCRESGKASEIIDFEAAKSMDDVILHVTSDEFFDTDVETSKKCATGYVFAESRDAIFQQLDELYSKLFKKKKTY